MTDLNQGDSGEIHKLILKTALSGFVQVDMEGHITEVNDAYCRMSGYAERELIGMKLSELEATEDAAAVKAHMERVMNSGGEHFESRHLRKDGTVFDVEASIQYLGIGGGLVVGFFRDITERKQAEEALRETEQRLNRKRVEEELKTLEWMLTVKPPAHDVLDQGYGDLTTLNQGGLIKRSIDQGTLRDITSEYLKLLESSSAIYEKNGDYAYGIFSSGWCRLMDSASRQLCRTDDNEAALASGKWLCHESCWTDCSRRAIITRSPVDIECNGGMRLYAVPVFASGEVIGAINFGYGTPPRDAARLRALGKSYGLTPETLAQEAGAYASRPAFIVELAKQRLLSSARLIGLLVERKQSEEELRESQQSLALAVSSAHLGIWDWDIVNNRMTWDDQMYRLYGVTDKPSESGVEIWENGLHPDDKAYAWEACQAALRGEKQYEIEFRVRWPDGIIRHIKANGVVLRGGDGKAVRMLGTNIDITEHKRAEETIRLSAERLQLALKATNDVIWDWDVVQDLQTWNASGAVVFGWTDIVEKPQTAAWWTDRVHPDDRQRVAATFHAAVLDPSQMHWQDEYRFRHANGQYRIVLDRGYISREARGRAVRMIGAMTDITERRHIEERLRQSEKMTAIGQLAGGVAHDFNNQLGGVLGYAEMLAGRMDDPNLKRYALNILTAANRAADLTKQLLAFSRKGKYLSIPVDLHQVIAEVVALLSHSLDKRIEIHQQLNANPGTVTGDPTQLQNAFLNLAVNASDAMPTGGILSFSTLVLELVADPADPEIQSGRYVQVSVSDNGCGMDAEIMKHLFEPFFTTKEVGKGTGLGLAAVHGAVKNHHGRIRVESQPGKGTTFFVCLPLQEVLAAAEDGDPAAVTILREAHILVVDDEEIIRELAADLLRSLGYKVMTCANGEEAMGYYLQSWEHVDLVLLDMVMPRMGGRDTFVAMRKINPNVKALLSSGHSITGEAQSILDEGVLAFIQKPFKRSELAEKVAAALSLGEVEGFKKIPDALNGKNRAKGRFL